MARDPRRDDPRLLLDLLERDSAPAARPAHPAPPAPDARRTFDEDPAPRRRTRRPRLDDFDRFRLGITAFLLWCYGLLATVLTLINTAGFAILGAMAAGAVLQIILSSGQVLIWRRLTIGGGSVGLVLVAIDGALNLLGTDVLVPALDVALRFDATNGTLWVGWLVGAIVASLPEVFVAELRR